MATTGNASIMGLTNDGRALERQRAAFSFIRTSLHQQEFYAARNAFLNLPDLDCNRKFFLEEVLRDGYASTRLETPTIITFLEGLPVWHWALDGCVILHDVYSNVQAFEKPHDVDNVLPIMPLALFLHKLLQQLEGDERARAETYFYTWIPYVLRCIIQGTRLRLESCRGEILYAPAFTVDRSRRMSFVWRDKWTPDADKEKWRIIPASSKADLFYIQSVYSSEYLYGAAEMEYGKDTRIESKNMRYHALLWRHKNEVPGDFALWQVVSLDDSSFALYNPTLRQYLCAPKSAHYCSERNHVLTSVLEQEQKETFCDDERRWKMVLLDVSLVEEGVSAFFRQDYTQAVELLTRAMYESDDYSQHVTCLAYRMTANLRLRHFDDIQDDLKEIELYGGENAAIFHNVSHLWLESTEFADFYASCKSNLESHQLKPVFAKHEAMLGDQHFINRSYATATESYEIALGLAKPFSTDIEQWLDVYLNCAKCYFAMDEVDACDAKLQQLRQVLETQGSTGISSTAKCAAYEVQVRLWEGKNLRKQHDYLAALASFQEAADVLALCGNKLEEQARDLHKSVRLELQLTQAFVSESNSEPKSVDSATGVDDDIEDDGKKMLYKHLIQMSDTFHCPLSLEIMTDPVVTPNGDCYERVMIERHLEINGKFDPLTRTPLAKENLYPNKALKVLVAMMLSEDHNLGLLLASCLN